MRAVVQRVKRARVCVETRVVGSIEAGYMVLLGIEETDTAQDAAYIGDKLVGLRLFEDEQGKMNRSLAEAGGAALLVSQFTLLGDARKGRRPSFISAARLEQALPLYEAVVQRVREHVPVQTGEFGADMQIELVCDGPVTILLDSGRLF